MDYEFVMAFIEAFTTPYWLCSYFTIFMVWYLRRKLRIFREEHGRDDDTGGS